MNYISGTILFIIQLILSIRIGKYDNSFHILYLSTIISFINLIVNTKYYDCSQFLIVVQTILLNLQFAFTDYQAFVYSLLDNKPEMFLVGLGYGHLHCIIFQSLHKWYVRGATALSICLIGFFWSYTPMSQKFAYLVPLYLSTIFVILSFFLWERFEKENFCLLFIQNKSLIDWQRIIKENIPQSMVFVTCPKKKALNQQPASKSLKLKDSISKFCGKLLPEKIKAKWNIGKYSPSTTNKGKSKSDILNVRVDSDLRNPENFENKNRSMSNQTKKPAEDEGLVFNFVNKKFYDQFQIRDWVEIQRKSITQNLINLNFGYSFGELINQDDPQQINLICTESPIHQILFNNIFKNIIVQNNSQIDSKTYIDIDNAGDPTQHSVDSSQNLCDYLKHMIEEKKMEDINHYLQKQTSKSRVSKDTHFFRHSFDPIKQLSCFYRQLSPFFLLGSQFMENNNEINTLKQIDEQAKQASEFIQNQQLQQQKIEQTEHNTKNLDTVKEETNPDRLSIVQRESPFSNQASKNNTANFGTQNSKQFDTKADIEAHILDHNYMQNSSNNKLSFKKIDSNGQLNMHHQISDIPASQQNQQTFCVVSPLFSENKETKKEIENTDEHHQLNTQQHDYLETNHHQNSQTHLRTLNEEKQAQPIVTSQVKQSQKMTTKQVTFQSNENLFEKSKQNTIKQPASGKQNEGEKQKNISPARNNVVQNVIHNENKVENNNKFDVKDFSDDMRGNKGNDNQDNAIFFDTQMVRCLWGNEEGILLIFNDISLKIINEKLREIERFKDKMLSTVTHDLKTPLNSIIMILENSFQLGRLNKKQRKIILQNSQMLMSLINDILDYSQLRRDKFRLIIEEICVTQCIMDVVDLFEIQAEQKRISINAKFVNIQQKYIMQDERRIKQILVNLIGNAIKFTQQEGKIDVIVKQKFSDNIQISVKDTGTGISEQIQKKLFQFFNTFDHSERANNRHGIGLGLAICKQLNTQLGPWHEIKLKSKENKGSKFTFCIYTNLIEHQQLPQPLHNQNSPLKRTNTFENAQMIYQNVQNNVQPREDVEGLHEMQKSPINNENKDSHYLHNKPPLTSINHLSPQPQKTQKSKNGLTQDNQGEKSQKSDFNSQHELSKSANSPNNNQFNKSLKIEEIQTDNNHQKSREIQSNIHRNTLTPRAHSTVIINPQQHSTSIIKYQEQKNQQMAPRRSVKRDYIVIKGSRHKLLNSQKAFTMKLLMDDYKRRQKSLMFGKAQTVDTSLKQLQKQVTTLSNQGNDRGNTSLFYSEKVIPGSPRNPLRSEGQGAILTYLQNKPNIQQSLFSQANPTKSHYQNQQSMNTHDTKRMMDNKAKENTQMDNKITHLHKLQFQRQQSEKETQEALAAKKNIFVRVVPKNAPMYNTLLDPNSHPYQKDTDIHDSEINKSENFGENEELYKKYLENKGEDPDLHNQLPQKDIYLSGKNQFQGILSGQLVQQSIPYGNADFTQASQQLDKIGGHEYAKTNSIYQYQNSLLAQHPKLGEDSNAQIVQYIEKHPQRRYSVVNSLSKHQQFFQRSQKQTDFDLSEKQNNRYDYQEEEEEDDTDLYNMINRVGNTEHYCDSEKQIRIDDDDRYIIDSQNNLNEIDRREDDDDDESDTSSNLKYMENNVEKQMIWIQNDRMLQAEMLKTLLLEYQRVLIADDSPFNIFCLKDILQVNTNLEIYVAYNGSEALNSYQQYRQQIIFMDLNMPVLDGYECLKCIRQYEEDNKIEDKTKIIVISAQEYEPFFSNFDGYLSKPIKLIDIISLLQIFRSNVSNATSSDNQI